MKLRWIEREVEIETIDSGCYTQTVKVLQYLDETPNRFGKDTWVDIPTVKEEG